MLSDGMDTYNVLVPHSGCLARDLYAQYANIRGELALSQSEPLQIDGHSSSQPWKTFGLHPNFLSLQQLYNDKDLVLLTNTRVLQQFVTKVDWYQKKTTRPLYLRIIPNKTRLVSLTFLIPNLVGVCVEEWRMS